MSLGECRDSLEPPLEISTIYLKIGKSVKGPLSGSAICNRPPASGFFAKGPLWKRFCKRPPAVPVHYAVHVLDKTVQLYETATGLSSTLPGHYRRTVYSTGTGRVPAQLYCCCMLHGTVPHCTVRASTVLYCSYVPTALVPTI